MKKLPKNIYTRGFIIFLYAFPFAFIKLFKLAKRHLVITGFTLVVCIFGILALSNPLEFENKVSDFTSLFSFEVGKDANKNPEIITVKFSAGEQTFPDLKISADETIPSLPIPSKKGYKFKGWFTQRAGDVELVPHASIAPLNSLTVYARWKKQFKGIDKNVHGVPVLLYHWFFDDQAGDPQPLYIPTNWMSKSQLEEEFEYLTKAGFYFPTWKEMSLYINGEIDLPKKSVVVSIDDGEDSFWEIAVPVSEKYGIPITGFIIGKRYTLENAKVYQASKKRGLLSLQSHSYDMHRPGEAGEGLIYDNDFNSSLADLKTAVSQIGEDLYAFAYPYGDTSPLARSVLRKAQFKMAFLAHGDKVKPGMQPLLLPRVIVNHDETLSTFKSKVN